MRFLTPLFIVIVMTSLSSAQGLVTFRNSVGFLTPDPTGGDRLVYDIGSPLDLATGVGLSGTQYVAELYVGTDAGSLTPLTDSISRFRSSTTVNKGRWGNSTIYGPANDPIVLPGFVQGDTATLQVKVWDFSQFSTYEEAAGHGPTGASVPFSYPISLCPPGPICYEMEGLQAFALVPEPSAVALMVFGLSSMLVLGHRKWKQRSLERNGCEFS